MMSKCGKGCLPECEYFTTGGCISPFNCAYKIEEYNQNTVFTNGDINNLSGIEKFFINTVKNGALPQEPMNYDGAAMKAYISYLENENERLRTENAKIDEYKCVIDNISKQCEELKSENVELRARLDKAVDKQIVADVLSKYFDCPCNFSPIDEEMWEYCGDDCVSDNKVCWERFIKKAEARLAELKGEK